LPQGNQLEEVAVTAHRIPTWNPGVLPEAPLQNEIFWALQQLVQAISDPCPDPKIRCGVVLVGAGRAGGARFIATRAGEVLDTEAPLSLYDTSNTRARSQYLNAQTNVGAAEFQENLISNGYNVMNQSEGATVLDDGTNIWTIYTRTSVGVPGAQFFGGNGSVVKYSLGGP
jgi:hypothetical protein